MLHEPAHESDEALARPRADRAFAQRVESVVPVDACVARELSANRSVALEPMSTAHRQPAEERDGVVPRVLAAATHFKHFGERAIGDVPVAMPGDPLAISTFARRIERLCGVRLVDHMKEAI